jgi:hypothetical protein
MDKEEVKWERDLENGREKEAMLSMAEGRRPVLNKAVLFIPLVLTHLPYLLLEIKT